MWFIITIFAKNHTMGTLLDKPQLTPPNEQGYQFGVDEGLTKYAQTEQYNAGNVLPAINYHVLQVWKDGNLASRLIVDSKTNKPVYDTGSYEAIAAHLDMMKLKIKGEKE